MPRYRSKNFKSYRNKERPYNEMETKPFEDAGIPSSDPKIAAEYVVSRSFKDLQVNMDSITVKANPQGELIANAVPYAIINRNNRMISGNFGSQLNESGNIIPILMTDQRTKLLKYYDVGLMNLQFNYNFIDMAGTADKTKTKANTTQQLRIMSEAISKAYSETFMDLPFFSLAMSTDSSIPGITDDVVDGEDVTFNATPEMRLLATSTWYQSVIQNLMILITKINNLYASEKLAKDMTWNREAPRVNQLYGMLKKKTVVASFESIADSLYGMYIDKFWFNQVASIQSMMSRRSNSMTEPVLELSGLHVIPTLKLYYEDSGILAFDSEKTVPLTLDGQPVTMTIRELIKELNDRITFFNVMTLIRNSNYSLVSFINSLGALTTAIIDHLVRIKSELGAFITVLDVMNRVGINGWVKDIQPIVRLDSKYDLVCNLTVENIFTSILSSANTMFYNPQTFNWEFRSLFDKYRGIPSYDQYTNGSLISFSARNLAGDNLPDDTNATVYLLPTMFKPEYDIENRPTAKFMNRQGLIITLTGDTLESSGITDSSVLTRIIPIEPFNYTDINLPQFDAIFGTDPEVISAAYYLIEDLFGVGLIKTHPTANTAVVDVILSSDKLFLVDVQVSDINNRMISYFSAHTPFRTQTKNDKDYVGFGSISK